MFSKRNLMIGVLAWAFFGASNVLALSHQHHQKKIVSPFDEKKEAKSLHCQLKGHIHFGFCPHSIPDKSLAAPIRIAGDCGGRTPEAIPSSSSIIKNLFVSSAFNANPVLHSSKIMMEILPFYDFLLPDQLAPPPRFI